MPQGSPDIFTGSTSLDFAKAAYDRMAYFALRPQMIYDNFADVEPTRQSMQGASVQFTIVNDLPPVYAALANESLDVQAQPLSDSVVVLTLAEYGNAIITTAKLRGEAFVEIDPVVANVIGFNAGVSIDGVARAAVIGGTNVWYSPGQGATQAAINAAQTAGRNGVGQQNYGSLISSADVLTVQAKLRAANTEDFDGYYAGVIHPSTKYDLMNETSVTSWRYPHNYADPAAIWQGEIGTFEGVRFVESPRAPVFGGTSGGQFSGYPYYGAYGTTTVFATLILGRQALAKAYSITDGNGAVPHIIDGPVTDHLRRFVPLGWYWLGAYGIFRQAAMQRIESATTLGDINPGPPPSINE